MAEKPGLQAFTHWLIIDEQWMAEKPGLLYMAIDTHTGLLYMSNGR